LGVADALRLKFLKFFLRGLMTKWELSFIQEIWFVGIGNVSSKESWVLVLLSVSHICSRIPINNICSYECKKYAKKIQENNHISDSNHGSTGSDSTIYNLTAGASAVPRNDKNCLDIQFNTLESDKTITIGTSHDEYSVEIDYYVDTGGFAQNPYYKNVAADEPTGDVLLPGGETITITLRTVETITSFGTHVTLYDNKVSDCKILLGLAKEKDKIDFEFVDVQQIDEFTVQLTVRVPDATDIDKDFTNLGVQFPSTPESNDYYLMSNRVVVN
jgi:hypothetical protein